MFTKKYFSFLGAVFSLLGIFLLVSGCGKEETIVEQKNNSESTTLRVLYSYWPPDMMAYLAQEKGFFKKNNVNVELVWVDGITENLEKRKSGEIHVWNFTLLDFLTEYAEKIETNGQVILVEDYSEGADAIITRPEKNIKTVQDLKGKKVAVEKGTIGEFFLQILLQRANLELSDVIIEDIEFQDIPKALKDNRIDAGVTYEPGITEALSDGAMILVDSKQERGVIVDVLVANRDHVQKNKEAYKAFIKSLLEAGDYFRTHPEESAEIMKDPLEMSKEEVLEAFDKLKIPDLRENLAAFDRSSGSNTLYSLGRLAQKYLQEQNPRYEEFDIDSLINSDLIREIQ